MTTLPDLSSRIYDGLNAEQAAAVALEQAIALVEAGAGTGKTRVLTRRYLRAVIDQRIAVESIVALTFTRAAAATMQVRVREGLQSRAQDSEASVEERRRARTALEQLDRAVITTIDGFCARILREFALHAGLDPSFRQFDELQAGALQLQVIAERLAYWERASEWEADFALLFTQVRWQQAGERPQPGEFGRRFIRLYDAVRTQTVGEFAESVLAPEIDPGLLVEALDELETLWDETDLPVGKRGDNGSTRLVEACDALLPSLAQLIREGDYLTALTVAHELNTRCSFRGGAAADVRLLRSYLSGAFRDDFIPLLVSHAAQPHRVALARALRDFDEAYSLAKALAGALDFADLPQRLIALLEGTPWVREMLRERYRLLLIDEFQDTSPVQLRLAELLGPSGGEGSRQLFVVGDPKQSIYGFRQADLVAYGAFVETHANGERQRLVFNYRSRREVLGFVNAALEGRQREPDPATGEEWGPVLFQEEARLQTTLEFPRHAHPDVELIAFPGNKEVVAEVVKAIPGGRHWERDDLEAFALVAYLKRCVEAKQQVHAVDPATGARITRDLDYRDITILMRAKASFLPFQRACRRLSVPHFVHDGEGFLAAREVRDVLMALQLLQDPADDLTCAGVLRGPLVGLSPGGLYTLTQEREFRRTALGEAAYESDRGPRRRTLWTLAAGAVLPSGLSTEDARRCRAFAALVEELRTRLASEGLPTVLDALYARTGLLESALAREEGLRGYGNLLKLRDIAAGFAWGGADALGAFVRAMQDYEEREARVGEAVVETPGGGAMALMTIHAAKGLEFPVVVVPALHRQRSVQGPLWGFDPVEGLGIQVDLDEEGEWARTASLTRLSERLTRADAAERHRLLYVALTRAEDRLILSGAIDLEAHGLEVQGLTNSGGTRGRGPLTREDCKSWLAEMCLDFGITEDADVDHEGPVAGGVLHQRAASTLIADLVTMLGDASHAPSPDAPPPSATLEAVWREVAVQFQRPMPIADPRPSSISMSELQEFALCPARHRLRKTWRVPPKPKEPTKDRQRRFGSALHEVLAELDLLNPHGARTTVEQVGPLALRKYGLPVDEGDIQRMLAFVESFLGSELYIQQIAVAAVHWQELPLRWRVSEDPQGRELPHLEGRLDLCFLNGDGSVGLVDYKIAKRVEDTDDGDGFEGAEAPEDTPESTYRFQFACYAMAIRRWRGTGTSITGYLVAPDRDYREVRVDRVELQSTEIATGVSKFMEALVWEQRDIESWPREHFRDPIDGACHRCPVNDLCPAYASR